jgi:hypothetical protein
MLVGEGGLMQTFSAKISPNYVTFTFIKEMKIKCIFTSYTYTHTRTHIYIFAIFFQVA